MKTPSQILAVEAEIISKLNGELKETGTTNIEGLKIVTKLNRAWNQDQVQGLIDDGIPARMFPFNLFYKEDKKKSDYLANNEPDTWAYIAKALTLKPAKPSISIIEIAE